MFLNILAINAVAAHLGSIEILPLAKHIFVAFHLWTRNGHSEMVTSVPVDKVGEYEGIGTL